jgi:GAF domain-containing protein
MSTPQTVVGAFADAVAALVGEPDVADILHHLVTDCAQVMHADAVAILARNADGELSLLSATSHRAAELEMLQAQRSAGPCIDVLVSNEAVSVSGSDQLRDRWLDVGRAIADAGFTSVEAFPMRWRGVALGGLNVFRSSPPPMPHDAELGQALADIATLAVVHSLPVSTEEAGVRLHEALSAREAVEQAKGVIAHLDNVDMSSAYDLLIRRAEVSGETLTQAALGVLLAQQRKPGSS